MAIYSCRVNTISRARARSATAAAAYRSGTSIEDIRTGAIHNYTNRGGVETTGIVLPKNAPSELYKRDTLWNEAEASENRKNSTVAREVLVAIPHELDQESREELIEGYSKYLSERYQTGVDYAIHEPDAEGDNRNYHAHILMTTRRIDEQGFGAKTRELDEIGGKNPRGKLEVNNIRQTWEERANKSLERSGREERIDCRSLKDQGIDREPTVHIGVSGSAIDRKGLFSERAELNKEIRQANYERIQLLKDLKSLHREKAQLSDELSGLYSEKKDASQQLNKATRLHDAVVETRKKSTEIFKRKEQGYEKYQSWHQREMQSAIKGYYDLNKSEPDKKRFFERQTSFEKRQADFEQKKVDQFQKMHETISEHRAPTRDDAIAEAAGKTAYERKIKKTEIQANVFADTKGVVIEKQALHDGLIEKIEDRNEQRKSKQKRIAENRELLEKVQAKLESTQTNLQENSKAMTNEDNELLQDGVPEDNTQALIDEGSQREAKAYESVESSIYSQSTTADLQTAEREQTEIEFQGELPDQVSADEQTQDLSLGQGSVGVDVGTDYSEGRERFIEMPAEQQAAINETLREDYEKNPDHRPYSERPENQEQAASPEVQAIMERAEEQQETRDEKSEERKEDDDLGY